MKKKQIIDMLNYWLRPTEALLADAGADLIGIEKTRRVFVNRQSNILFVAHLDTVQTPVLKKHKGNIIWAAGLDDRLGCALADKLSRKFNVDLLLCDHEESAASTGQYHNLKEYNWIAEFDRSGGDVVTYDLDNDEFLANLGEYFDVGFGSFSDLCMLQTKACCVNVGIGYQLDHSEDSYVDLAILNNQLMKFEKFFNKHKDTRFTQDPEKIKYTKYYQEYYGNKYRSSYLNGCTARDEWDDQYRECDFCGNIGGTEIYGTRICQDCFEGMTSNFLYQDYEKQYNN